jgi:hypothetical protein
MLRTKGGAPDLSDLLKRSLDKMYVCKQFWSSWDIRIDLFMTWVLSYNRPMAFDDS